MLFLQLLITIEEKILVVLLLDWKKGTFRIAKHGIHNADP
jgi:hypothetical protein